MADKSSKASKKVIEAIGESTIINQDSVLVIIIKTFKAPILIFAFIAKNHKNWVVLLRNWFETSIQVIYASRTQY